MAFYVYILESEKDHSLYVGQTNDLKDRLKRHNAGSIQSTKGKKPYRLGYFEVHSTRREAMWREWQLKKRMSAEERRNLVNCFNSVTLNEILGP